MWYGNTSLEIDLPDEWDVQHCPMHGAGERPLTDDELAGTIKRPIDCPPLRELAHGKKKAVVIFDDMTRPTRAYQIVPIVIRELLAGGIDEDAISFVCALGTHGALTQHEFRKKLGTTVLERFRVYNHNCYENCVNVGTTSRGTKLAINREVMEADLKAAIGCVTAHPQVGFSGGGKVILPGVAHIDSVAHYHGEVQAQAPDTTGLGNFDRNVMRFDIEEAARMAALDFKVDVLVNGQGATTAAFAGDFLAVHARAVATAKDACATDPQPKHKQLVITNAFAKPNEMGIALLLGAFGLDNFTGTVVIIADAPEGQVVHYLFGRFGQHYGGRRYPAGTIPSFLDVIIQAPHQDRTFADWFSNPEVITWTKDWPGTMKLLRQRFGPGTRVAVVPNATMQYYAH
jgi:nickel-dependent lactate racemase